MSAMVLAMKEDVPKSAKFNRGGIVPGVGDSDMVPSLLTPGELIIPIVRAQGGGGVTINFNDSSIVSRTPAEQDKWIKDRLLPSLSRLKRKGIMI